MAETARQKLARIRADEEETNRRGKSAWVAPPDYQDIIKAAQAEARGSSSSNSGDKSGDKWKGLREVTKQGGSRDSSQGRSSTGNVPTPSSRSKAVTDNARENAPRNAPIPTARPNNEVQGPNQPEVDDRQMPLGGYGADILKTLIAAGITAEVARRMFGKAATGDREAIEDIKSVTGTDMMAPNEAGVSRSPDSARFGEDPTAIEQQRMLASPDGIVDAEFEELPPRQAIGDANINQMIDEVDGVPQDPIAIADTKLLQDQRGARVVNPVSEEPISVAPVDQKMLEGNYANMDAMIGKYLEEDDMPAPVAKSGRVGRDVRVKPKIKPKT